MEDVFPEFYRPDSDAVKMAWVEGTFMIDANVLLNLYRYQDAARNDLLGALRAIEERLWLPYQAAMEFQRNRLSVIADQKRGFNSVRDAIKNSQNDLEKKLRSLNLVGRHAHIQIDPLIEEMKTFFDTKIGELDRLEPQQAGPEGDDKLRQEIDELFAGKVGKKPDQAWVNAVTTEGKERYKFSVPPGFKDAEKKDLYSVGGINYTAAYGDLNVWKQILEHAKALDGKPVIFVTDDKKEDWWSEVSGKTIGPHPHLIAEMKTQACVANFQMYSIERFLKLAPSFLDIEVDKSSIEEAREVGEHRFHIGGDIISDEELAEAAESVFRFRSRVIRATNTRSMTVTVPRYLISLPDLKTYLSAELDVAYPTLSYRVHVGTNSYLVRLIGMEHEVEQSNRIVTNLILDDMQERYVTDKNEQSSD